MNSQVSTPASATPGANMNPTPSASVRESQIPNLLKIGAISDNVNQDVETDVLEPIVQSEKFIRFQLQNKGILHSHSKIQFCVKTATAGYLPQNIGISSLIQRATLKVGNKTLCEIDDFNHLQGFRSMFMSSEAMRERLMYQSGQTISHEFCYVNEGGQGDIAVPSATGGSASNTLSEGIGLDTGMNYETAPDRITDGTMDYAEEQQLVAMPFLTIADGNTARPQPTFQMSLSDLFPFLKINQLPLYMMREAIQLEFVLSNQTAERGIIDSTAGGVADTLVSLDTTKTRLIADYIYFPQEMMVQFANANKKLQFQYVDYRLSKQSVDPTTFTGTQIRNVGGAGRVVTKVISGLGNNYANPEAQLTSKYNAICPSRTYAALPGGYLTNTNGNLSLNVKYNDNFVYPIDVNNSARHFHNVVQGEGLVPYVSREEYAREGKSLTDREYLGQKQEAHLGGHFFWQCTKLLTGDRINSRGIELYTKYTALPGTSLTQRVWLEILRYAVIEDGITQCYYS